MKRPYSTGRGSVRHMQLTPAMGKVSFSLRQNIQSLLTPLSVKPYENVNNLGVILDADLTFQRHISNISETAFYHLRNI